MSEVSATNVVSRKLKAAAELYAEVKSELGTTQYCGHPKQIECAAKLFELWPHVQNPLRAWGWL